MVLDFFKRRYQLEFLPLDHDAIAKFAMTSMYVPVIPPLFVDPHVQRELN